MNQDEKNGFLSENAGRPEETDALRSRPEETIPEEARPVPEQAEPTISPEGRLPEEAEQQLPPEDRLPPEEKEPFDIRRELFDWAESLVAALLIIVILFAFFVRSIGVEGDSMQNTLHEGDFLIVSNLFYEPEPGDVIIVTKKTFMQDSIVKRVIAVGGQTVEVDYRTGEVRVDGEVLNEPYILEPMREKGDMSYPLTVPEDCVFVMGDNRNNSTDSRSSSLGVVDERYIVGHVLVRIWPLRSIGIIR